MEKNNGMVKKNIIYGIIVSFFVSFTFFVFGPLEMFLSEPFEFWFSIMDVMPAIMGGMILAFVGLIIIMYIASAIGERFLTIIIGMISALGVGLYVQGNWIFVDYGEMDGTMIDWSKYKIWGVVDTIIWVAVFVIIIILSVKNKSTIKIISFVFLGLLAVEVVTLCVLAISNIGGTYKANYTIQGGDEFRLSKDKDNIVIICADGFDGTDFIPVLEEEPELRASFDGFTFFRDTAGTSLYSEESGINLLTGNQFEVGPSFKDNVDRTYMESDLYEVLEKNGFETYLYVPEKMVSPLVKDQIMNFSESELVVNDYITAFDVIYKMVGFRYFPHFLKKNVWYSTMDLTKFQGKGEIEGKRGRLYSNYEVYDYLQENGVTTDRTSKIYQFFWIQGPHEPANTDRYCHKTAQTTDMDAEGFKNAQFEQTIGVVRLFSEIVKKMKDAGVYDNTAIIFTADHGWDIRTNPLFLIKPYDTHGELKVSDAPLSMIEDYVPTIEKLASHSNDVSGTVFSVSEYQVRKRLVYVYDINPSNRTYNSRSELWIDEGEFYEK